ncbi:MAG: pyridoxal phosphate-dependent aminotransferase [Planctomycetota bacterium]|nr:pyridoxal phosphate-dependent aminotransferase [Planctomycetota bacterium]
MNQLQPEGAYQTLVAAKRLEQMGRSIIHLEIGESDFPTPTPISEAGIRAISAGKTRYTSASGLDELKKLIAQQTSCRTGRDISENQVVIGPGAKPFLFMSSLAIVRPGDEVIYPSPGFPTYEAMIRAAGGTPIAAGIDASKDFALPSDTIRQRLTPRTRMIILNSPSNPTGAVISAAELQAIASLAVKNDLWVLSDEIYRELIYTDREYDSILSCDGMEERTIVVDGFSKSHSMTGWRLGYGVMPQPLADKVTLLLVHSVGCTAEFTQLAGITALASGDPECKAMRDTYRHRRNFVVERLNQMKGIRCQIPDGAFYVFPNIQGLNRSSQTVADELLHEAGVAVLPGTAFGKDGEGYIRLCFANSKENLEIGLDRIESWVKQLS